jgi:MoxR-like ATPase
VIARQQESPEAGGMVSPWHGTVPELIIAGVAVAAAAVAGYAVAGWAGLAVVAVVTAAAAMVLLRGLLPQLTPDVGASPRGGLALVQLARGQALLNKRDYVVPDDIKQVAVPALAHRVTLRPELWVRQVSADEVVAKLLSAVPTPKTDPRAQAVTG